MVFFGSTPCLCVLHSEKPHRSWCLKAMFCCILYWRLNDLEEVNECSFNLEHRKKFDFMVFLCKKQYTLNLDRKMYGNCKTFHENVCRKFNFTFSTNILLTFLTERKCWFFFSFYTHMGNSFYREKFFSCLICHQVHECSYQLFPLLYFSHFLVREERRIQFWAKSV